MPVFSRTLLILSIWLIGSAAHALESMPDADLADATAQEGIALQLEIRVNADAKGNALTTGYSNVTGLASAAVANSTDFTNCASETDFSSVGCRVAWTTPNRGSGATQKWLVVKNWYGMLNVPLLWLDGGLTPNAATAYADLTRFRDKNGVPLIASPNNMHYIKLQLQDDIQFNWNMGGLSFEKGATGYLTNSRPSLGGLRLGNSANDGLTTMTTTGSASIKGTVGLFGF